MNRLGFRPTWWWVSEWKQNISDLCETANSRNKSSHPSHQSLYCLGSKAYSRKSVLSVHIRPHQVDENLWTSLNLGLIKVNNCIRKVKSSFQKLASIALYIQHFSTNSKTNTKDYWHCLHILHELYLPLLTHSPSNYWMWQPAKYCACLAIDSKSFETYVVYILFGIQYCTVLYTEVHFYLLHKYFV